MKRELVVQANDALDNALRQVVQLVEIVRAEAPEEHLGYVALAAPVFVHIFSMSSAIWKEHPDLGPPEVDSTEDFSCEEVSHDDPYRWANSMKRETAEKVAGSITQVSSLLERAVTLLGTTCRAERMTFFDATRGKAEQALRLIRQRIESQHSGLTR